MSARLAADAVLVLHAVFIVWVAMGALAVARWPRLAWLHLPALAWGLWIEVSGGICPLTPLETALRHAAGQQGYADSFVAHHLGAWVYLAGLTRQAQWMLAGLLAVGNATVYGWMLWRRRRTRSG